MGNLDAPFCHDLDQIAGEPVGDIPADAQFDNLSLRMAFWPQLPGIAFRFEVAATDRSGSRVSFSLPMLFVSEVINADHARAVREAYSSAPDLRRTTDLGGADIIYDIDPAADPNDSRKSTISLTFSTEHKGVEPVHPRTSVTGITPGPCSTCAPCSSI